MPAKFTIRYARDSLTGGADGIGFATARLCSDRGESVCLIGVSVERLNTAAKMVADARVSTHVSTLATTDACAAAIAAAGGPVHSPIHLPESSTQMTRLTLRQHAKCMTGLY